MSQSTPASFPRSYDVPDTVRLRHQALLNVTCRPRRNRRAQRFAWGGVGVAGAAAAAVAGVLTLSSGTPAAWSATPTLQPATALPRLGAACAGRIQAAHFPYKFDTSTPVLAEKRGSTTAVVLAAARQTGICFSGSDESFSGFYNDDPHPAGQATVLGLIGAGNASRVLLGTARAGVTGISVTGIGSQPIQASLVNGHFLAWWPANLTAGPNQQLVVASGTTTTSTPLAQLDFRPPPTSSPIATH